MHKFTKSITKINSKIQEFKTNDEVINNPIYKNKWYKIINKELLSLNAY